MKKIFIICIVLFSCAKIHFPWDAQSLDEILINNEKPIMLYFYATW
tara:strand:+ start:2882 stop:3019 length:138 start_codon:yes stop_codon:yes gene_type:complete